MLTYIIHCQKMERTEDLVILKVETPCGLQILHVGIESQVLLHLLGASLWFGKLLAMRILGRGDPRSPSRATMVVVRMRIVLHVVRIVLGGIVIARHFGEESLTVLLT